MMIMRFHKLIQSKLLWLVFLGIVVTTFVGWGVASNVGSDAAMARLEEPVATIDGEEVTFLEFDVTRRLMEMRMRTPLPDERMRDLVLNHLAMADYARDMGIRVEPEIAEAEFARMFIGEDGQLNELALEGFRQSLRGTMISETDTIEFIREQMVVDQLRRALNGAVLVPDFDVDRWAELQTDEFVVQYSPVSPAVLEEEVEATEEQVAAFFEENPERFQLPEERVVRYLTLRAETFADQVDPATEEEALAVYQANPDDYVRTVEVPAEEEGGEATTQNQPIPFEEVSERIRKDLTLARRAKAAEELAMSLAVRLTPRRGRSGESMAALAEEMDLEVRTPPAFTRNTPLEGPANTAAFKNAAFKLDESEFGKRAGPIRIGNDFVIMELVDIVPPRVPELDEVRDRVAAAATNAERAKALNARAEALAEELRTAVENGLAYEEAAGDRELEVVTSDPISLQSLDPRRSMVPPTIVQELPSHAEGAVFGPLQSRFGGLFIAHVQSRTSRPVAKEEARPQLRDALANQLHFQALFTRFQEQIIQPRIQQL